MENSLQINKLSLSITLSLILIQLYKIPFKLDMALLPFEVVAKFKIEIRKILRRWQTSKIEIRSPQAVEDNIQINKYAFIYTLNTVIVIVIKVA